MSAVGDARKRAAEDAAERDGLGEVEREACADLASSLWCTQCGERFDQHACGPTHALIAADPRRHRLIAPLLTTAEERGYQRGRAEADALRTAAQHPHKGPNDTDASMLRSAATRLRGGFEPGGSNTKQTVARVIETVADLLDAAPAREAGDQR